MATVLPVRTGGTSGPIQPSSKALSMMETSMALMVTGSPLRPAVQEPSQGAGQTRPVNSGKLLVRVRRLRARCHWPR